MIWLGSAGLAGNTIVASREPTTPSGCRQALPLRYAAGRVPTIVIIFLFTMHHTIKQKRECKEFFGLYWYFIVQRLVRLANNEDAPIEEEIRQFFGGISHEEVEKILHQESSAFYNEYPST